MSELTESQRIALAAAAAKKLCIKCWNRGVEQVAQEVSGRVSICPWAPGSFSERDRAVIAEVWSSLAASKYNIELVVTDYVRPDAFEGVSR